MTINSPAAIIWAMYIAAAEKRGVPRAKLGGTIQNDILKEYIAQKEFIFPPKPSMRLVVDTMEFGTREMPLWNTISISGYHIREAGSTAAQELAFTLADGMEYVRWGIARGMNVDDFAPRLSFFFNAHNDFFEEIAKYRAARRIWAKWMREKVGAKNPRSWLMRFHTQTAGVSLTAQQPMNNVARVAIQALAAVLGGTQSLHTNSLDEAWALPSESAATIALRTQQIIANESGVTNTVDPLGGSYFVEAFTNRMEQEANAYFDKIEKLGGVLPSIENGFFQREIAESAARYQTEIEKQERIIVGVNDYVVEEDLKVPLLRVDEAGARHQIERLNRVRRDRDAVKVASTLDAIRDAAKKDAQSVNLMPLLIDAVNAYATLGEIMNVLRKVWGEYKEPVIV
jgi:methylmalonyl-CoA mutase N-terminal domain/subunit